MDIRLLKHRISFIRHDILDNRTRSDSSARATPDLDLQVTTGLLTQLWPSLRSAYSITSHLASDMSPPYRIIDPPQSRPPLLHKAIRDIRFSIDDPLSPDHQHVLHLYSPSSGYRALGRLVGGTDSHQLSPIWELSILA
ncbi:hypothetical protein KCU62_g330, partial [Aureobasidium sp. EXF-3399]